MQRISAFGEDAIHDLLVVADVVGTQELQSGRDGPECGLRHSVQNAFDVGLRGGEQHDGRSSEESLLAKNGETRLFKYKRL